MDGLNYASASYADCSARAKQFLEKMTQVTPVSRLRPWHQDTKTEAYSFSTHKDEADAIAFVLNKRIGMLKELCHQEGKTDRVEFLESIKNLPRVEKEGYIATVTVPAEFIENPLMLKYCENSLNCMRQNVTSIMSGTYVKKS